MDPSVVLQPLRDVPVDELGVTIPRLIIALWDSELGANMLAVFRSALTGADDGLVRVFSGKSWSTSSPNASTVPR